MGRRKRERQVLVDCSRLIIPRHRKVVVPGTRTAEKHDFISSDQEADHPSRSPCAALRAHAICSVSASGGCQPQIGGSCRFHQQIDDCTRLRALWRIGKKPSLSANDKRTDGVFNLIVADFNFAMLKECAEVCLLVLRTGNSVLQLACWTGNPIQPCPVRFHNPPDCSLRCRSRSSAVISSNWRSSSNSRLQNS